VCRPEKICAQLENENTVSAFLLMRDKQRDDRTDAEDIAQHIATSS
jgi:hypothetical protein